MKIKISRKQWENIGNKSGWVKKSQTVTPTKFLNCMLDISKSDNMDVFATSLRNLCVRYNVKLDIVNKTIDV